MKSPLRKELLRWLAAERGGREREAEEALTRVFRAVGRVRPRAGFARRTLRAAGILPKASARWWHLPEPALRLGAAAALGLAALSFTLFEPPVALVAGAAHLSLGVGTSVLATLCERLAHGFTAWEVLARISGSLLNGLAEPRTMTVLGLALLTSFFAFGWLSQLLSVKRSTEHV